MNTPIPLTDLAPAPQWLAIDALNVAHWAGREATLRLPLALLAALLRQGHSATLYFDASAPYRLAAEATVYAALRSSPHCRELPAGRRADGELLRDARQRGGGIISRDHFADYRRRYRKLIDTPGRRLEGFVRDNVLQVPALALATPVPANAEAALAMLGNDYSR